MELFKYNTKIICILAFLTIITTGFIPVDASISVQSSSVQSVTAPINIGPGLSVALNISSTFSGSISIKSPSGSSAGSLSFSNLSGSYSGDVNLSEIGNYEVTENYTLTITAKSLLGDYTSGSQGSNTWTFDNVNIGVGKFTASSSVGSITVGQINGPVSVSAGSSLPTTATITTTGQIPAGTTVSASLDYLWTVSSSITPPPPTGTISVSTNHDSATFSLSGAASYSGSGKSWSKNDALVGEFTITYNEIPGYITPPSETKTLTLAGTISFSGQYTPKLGTVEVTTNLDEANFSISGPDGVFLGGSGKSWTSSKTLIGRYTINFGFVAGYKAPSPSSQTLSEDGKITFTGNYERVFPGKIEVYTNLEQASFTLSGAALYNGSGLYWEKIDAIAGEYTIIYDKVDGYETPKLEKKELSSGGILVFNAEYRETVPNTIKVYTNLQEATFKITGPANYSGKGTEWIQSDVPPGEYKITYGNVNGYKVPQPETKSLIAGGSITFNVEYMPITQTDGTPPVIKKVTISGSPANLKGTIRITVIADPKCQATFSIEDIIDGKLIELNTPGIYSASFTPLAGFDVIDVPININVKNDAELETVDSSQTVTIDTLAKITSVNLSKDKPMVGETVTIAVTADRKSNVSFSISGIAQGQMIEDKVLSGLYTASFVMLKKINDVPLEIKIIDPSGNFATDASKIISTMSDFGNIEITTNLDFATFTLTNTSANITYVGMGKSWKRTEVPIGEYKVTFGSILNYNTPKEQTGILNIGETIIFASEYSLANGKIMVRTNLEEAKFKIKSLVEYNGGGLNWSKENVESGQYTIIYEDVSGYETPPSETKVLDEDGKISFIGGYKHKYGTIEVATNLDEAKFKISGAANYEGSGKQWSQTSATNGEYTITFSDISGYITPQTTARNLSVGGSVNFYGIYTRLEGTIIVRTNLESAEFRLTGPAEYEGNGKYWKITNAPLGKYTIEYKNMPGYKIPITETKELSVKGITFIGGYEESDILASPDREQFANRLMPNFPNPCNPGTWIPFTLSDGGEVNIVIYDIMGRIVRKLELGYKNKGIYASTDKSAYWDGSNEYGEKVASGVYFYHIRSGNFSAIRRMLVNR